MSFTRKKMQNRTIFIWDIHWCYDEFQLLINKLEITKNDIIYAVWDIINKWPKSFEVLNFFYENQEQYKCVIGNHEVHFIEWLEWKTKWEYNNHFKKLYDKISKNNNNLLDFIKKLPKYIEKDNFTLIHGWLIPKKSIEEHSLNEITKLRDYNGIAWYEYYQWTKKIIYWHWALAWLKVRENTIGLDSGCVYGKELSAYILESGEIIQQQALKPYCKIT
jgi:hypothetical protein